MARVTIGVRHTSLVAVVVAIIALGNSRLAAQDAASLFKTKCAACHGADGKGDTPMGKENGAAGFRFAGSAENE